MSAEAINAVIEHSPARGTALKLLLLIAHASRDRASYPRSEIGAGLLAKQAKLCVRRVRAILAEMQTKGHLSLIRQGGGDEPNMYEIPVLKPYGVGVLKLAPVIREEPIDATSRADLHSTAHSATPVDPPSNVIQYPKPKHEQPTRVRRISPK